MTDFGLPVLCLLGTHIYRNTARKTGRQTDRQILCYRRVRGNPARQIVYSYKIDMPL